MNENISLIYLITINGINMVQCGDYNWEILKETDGSDVYRMSLRTKYKSITLMYGEGNFTIRTSDDFFIFEMDFIDTPKMVERLINGEGATLAPIYHKDTVKIRRIIGG